MTNPIPQSAPGIERPRRSTSELFSPELFPTTSAYVCALPDGLSALPECLVKGSLVRELLAMRPVSELRGTLPAVLEDYFLCPPDVTSWVPEVHMHAFLQAAFDRTFARSALGEVAFLQWMRDSNRALFKSPIYRILFFLISPENFFHRSDRRWSTFRRGSTLEKLVVEPGRAHLRIHHPRGLYSPLSAKTRAVSFRVAAECAGARALTSVVDHRAPTEFDILIQWQ